MRPAQSPKGASQSRMTKIAVIPRTDPRRGSVVAHVLGARWVCLSSFRARWQRRGAKGQRDMTRQFEGNEDWIKRGQGRVPSKGALAAERASAGLGTSDDEGGAVLGGELSPPKTLWPKPERKTSGRSDGSAAGR